MRTTDMLKDMENIHRLNQWLYADETHNVTVKNTLGARLELSMNQEGDVLCKYLDMTGQPVEPYDHMLSVPVWLGIIEQLQGQPSVTGKFDSRWEEIKFEIAFTRTMMGKAAP